MMMPSHTSSNNDTMTSREELDHKLSSSNLSSCEENDFDNSTNEKQSQLFTPNLERGSPERNKDNFAGGKSSSRIVDSTLLQSQSLHKRSSQEHQAKVVAESSRQTKSREEVALDTPSTTTSTSDEGGGSHSSTRNSVATSTLVSPARSSPSRGPTSSLDLLRAQEEAFLREYTCISSDSDSDISLTSPENDTTSQSLRWSQRHFSQSSCPAPKPSCKTAITNTPRNSASSSPTPASSSSSVLRKRVLDNRVDRPSNEVETKERSEYAIVQRPGPTDTQQRHSSKNSKRSSSKEIKAAKRQQSSKEASANSKSQLQQAASKTVVPASTKPTGSVDVAKQEDCSAAECGGSAGGQHEQRRSTLSTKLTVWNSRFSNKRSTSSRSKTAAQHQCNRNTLAATASSGPGAHEQDGDSLPGTKQPPARLQHPALQDGSVVAVKIAAHGSPPPRRSPSVDSVGSSATSLNSRGTLHRQNQKVLAWKSKDHQPKVPRKLPNQVAGATASSKPRSSATSSRRSTSPASFDVYLRLRDIMMIADPELGASTESPGKNAGLGNRVRGLFQGGQVPTGAAYPSYFHDNTPTDDFSAGGVRSVPLAQPVSEESEPTQERKRTRRWSWVLRLQDFVSRSLRATGQDGLAQKLFGSPLPGARAIDTTLDHGRPPIPYRCFALTFVIVWIVTFTLFGLCGWLPGTVPGGSADTAGSLYDAERHGGQKAPTEKGAPLVATPNGRLERSSVTVPSNWVHADYLKQVRNLMDSAWKKASDPVAKACMLDSLWAMDLSADWSKGREVMRDVVAQTKGQSWGSEKISSHFELVDALGGLVASYALSGNKFTWDLATDFSERAMKVFKTATGFPSVSTYLVDDQKKHQLTRDESFSITEIGEMGLPFLSAGLLIHGSSAQSSELWTRFLYPLSGLTDIHGDGNHELLPTLFSVATPESKAKWRSTVTPFFGESSRAVIAWRREDLKTVDIFSYGYYEFLLKGHLLLRDAWSGSSIPYTWGKLFKSSMEAIMRDKLRFGRTGDVLLINSRELMTAESCPFAGLLSLGSRSLGDNLGPWLEAAKGMGEACHRMFKADCAGAARLSSWGEVDPIARVPGVTSTGTVGDENNKKGNIRGKQGSGGEASTKSPGCSALGEQSTYLLAGTYYELWQSTGDSRWQRYIREVINGVKHKHPALLRFSYFAHAPPKLTAFLKSAILTREGHPLRAPDTTSDAPTTETENARNTTPIAEAVYDQRVPQPDSDRAAEEAASTQVDTSDEVRGPGSQYLVSGQPVRVGPSVFKKMRYRPTRTYPVEQRFANGRKEFMGEANVLVTRNFLDDAEDWNAGKKWDLNYIIDTEYVASLHPPPAKPLANGKQVLRKTLVQPGTKPTDPTLATA
ncbi:unnamed protein product [Amoebophrya sp. A25]|nr:unnamed protein product [Amoebophrya sp. A25]|eukprot:GSA25T00015286001.1